MDSILAMMRRQFAGWRFRSRLQTPDDEKLQELEREVAELRAAMEELRNLGLAEDRLAEIERRLGILAEEIEDLKVGEAAREECSRDRGAISGLGPAASKVYQKDHGVSIGGYGEALLEFFDDSRDDGRRRAARSIGSISCGRSSTSATSFPTAGSSTPRSSSSTPRPRRADRLSVEFAYLDYLYRDGFNLRTGLVLVPMGWLNELHEPTVYLGAVRPRTENVIIPTTWRENGIGAYGAFGGFDYRTYVVNGLDASGFSAKGLRGGRQKGAKAKAEDFAWVGRLDYTGVPGSDRGRCGLLRRLGSGSRGHRMVNRSRSAPRSSISTSSTASGASRLRGLWARAELDDVARLNEALGYAGDQSVGETLEGGYLEAGYDVLAGRGTSSLTPYLRWERLNTQQEVPDGWTRQPGQRRAASDAGSRLSADRAADLQGRVSRTSTTRPAPVSTSSTSRWATSFEVGA